MSDRSGAAEDTRAERPGWSCVRWPSAPPARCAWQPGTIIADIPTPFRTSEGLDAPLNFDRRHYGPVTMRHALATSLNVSAMRTLTVLSDRAVCSSYHPDFRPPDLQSSCRLTRDHKSVEKFHSCVTLAWTTDAR